MWRITHTIHSGNVVERSLCTIPTTSWEEVKLEYAKMLKEVPEDGDPLDVHIEFDFGQYGVRQWKQITRFAPYTEIGGYTIVYIYENGIYCNECASKMYAEARGNIRFEYDTYDEGCPIECADCGKDIESSYGDPYEE